MSPCADPIGPPILRSAVVLRVEEERCYVAEGASIVVVEYAPQFPAPRVERVAPGHRVALATASRCRSIAVWRWYDAVVIGNQDDHIRLYEPAHGEVMATPRDRSQVYVVGSRAYLSAGLPGADWWVAGAVAAEPVTVELDEVAELYSQHHMWGPVLG